MLWGFLGDTVVKNMPANAGDVRHTVSVPGEEDHLEEGMATLSRILAWRIWTEEPGGLQSIGAQRVGQGGSNLACVSYEQVWVHWCALPEQVCVPRPGASPLGRTLL